MHLIADNKLYRFSDVTLKEAKTCPDFFFKYTIYNLVDKAVG